ncbi:flagellar hook-length control protein FliK [Alkalimarinus alittae]|uniref:Flagellar hook-length control protein FliK n=1 Tax=Alkalimarinus alittae TaxID=2961619 RepID=A0ABY6MYP9_9ALTE|nr:flagellar hook-length control protein FliK [Alkalimarinus alittae]UZE94949.1 flagellar hook-length control protein FliK [Alkalimarinus alittae]
MNSLPVSLDLTSNSTSKPSTKASASNDSDVDSFKNELNKQEKNTKHNDVASTSTADKNAQGSETNKKQEAATVAAEETSNGEALPQSVDDEASRLDGNLEKMVDPDYTGELEIPSEFSLLNHVEDPLVDDELTAPPMGVLGYEMLAAEDGDYAAYGQARSAAGSLNAGVLNTAAANASIGDDALLEQPLEKLMTLEQIKLSLEKGVEALAELEIDVDTGAEGSVREVFRFNDLQLKEGQSTLKTYTTSVDLPVAPGAWTDKVNDKIIWLANQKIQFAEIHLNPQDLGPMEVKINVQNEQAMVTFTSHNQGVRELLEQNVNRLREMMNENGVDLAHVDVSDQSSQQQANEDQDQEQGVGGRSAEGDNDLLSQDGAHGITEAITLDNLVDYYA